MTERTTTPGGRHSAIVLAVVLACQLMVGIDATIVNIALPEIQTQLHFSQTGLAWVFNAYTLAFGGLLLLGGRAGDLLGRRRMFAFGVLLFTAASLLGGLATQSWWLVAARALQGIGGAMASPNVLSLIMSNYEDGPRRTHALSVFAVASSASLALGLLAGGALTSAGSWRWVFFVNVPIGAAILILTPIFVHETETHRGRFDLVGAITATIGVAGLAYGVIRTATSGWGDPITIAVFVAAVLVLVCFILVEKRAEQPIMPLRLFADRRRAAAYVNTLLVPSTIFAVIYFLTQYLQEGFGYGPLATGVAFLPMTVVLMGVVRLVGRLIKRWGTRPVMAVGIAFVTAALLWLTRLTSGSGYLADVLGPLVLLGVGAGLTTVALSVTSLSGVRREDSGAGAGLFQTLQWTSWSLGLAVLVTVYHQAATEGGGVAESLARGTASAFAGASVIAVIALISTLIFVRSAIQPGAPAAPADPPAGKVPPEQAEAGARSRD
ncbi:MFS transporter [Streptosporangium sp. NPDC051022]|uniref:MFS transporter n=1 Tax=Streptosporangium sp. NPDC051022 TaxID=3155752 RepID=UPI003423CCC8